MFWVILTFYTEVKLKYSLKYLILCFVLESHAGLECHKVEYIYDNQIFILDEISFCFFLNKGKMYLCGSVQPHRKPNQTVLL